MTAKLLFLEQFSIISGGQKVLLDIIDTLDRQRYEAQAVLPAEGELAAELDKRQVKYYLLPVGCYSTGPKSWRDILRYAFASCVVLPRLVSIIKKENITLVYANAPRTYFWAVLAARLTGRPVVWHLHSVLKGWELKFCLLLDRFFKVDRLIAISWTVAAPFTVANGRLMVIYNGVNVEKYNAARFVPAEVKAHFGIPSWKKVVCYIGQIARWKGVEEYVRAAELVSRIRPDALFLLVGDVLYGDPGYRGSLERLVENLKLRDAVIFLGRRQDVDRILAMVDILVVPSLEPEPLSLALLEGMASAKAVVATNHGGPAEIITDGVNGKLFAPGDIVAFAEILEKLVKNDELRERLGANARKKIEAELTVKIFAKKINRLLDREII